MTRRKVEVATNGAAVGDRGIGWTTDHDRRGPTALHRLSEVMVAA